MKTTKAIALIATISCAGLASAELIDRAPGLPIGSRMTLRPYVSLSYTYDTNVDSDKTEENGSSWIVAPAFDLDYNSENWNAIARVWYQYHAYNGYSDQLNTSSYGQSLDIDWKKLDAQGKGWMLTLSERFVSISQDDDMTSYNGRGLGRDRMIVQTDAMLAHNFTDKFHMAVNAGYYMLDYDNDMYRYGPLYGWERASVGGQIGYTLSKWTDLLFGASYQWYWHDNVEAGMGDVPDASNGWTVSAGIGSQISEKIKYRALLGWSRYESSRMISTRDNAVYSLSAQWTITDTLKFMLLGSSFYHPSEVDYASSTFSSTLSAGLAKSFVRGKITGTVDLAYRHEENESANPNSNWNFDEDILISRIGLNYRVNRFVSAFGRVEYQLSDSTDNEGWYDYDRWRATFGMRFSY